MQFYLDRMLFIDFCIKENTHFDAKREAPRPRVIQEEDPYPSFPGSKQYEE
jgi:hypothetical protein